jgi:hypothetical protein
MKRTGSGFLLAVVLLALARTPAWSGGMAGPQGPTLTPSAEFEGGRLYRAGAISVVELAGTYRQMGRQYGRLLGGEMKTLYRDAVEEFFVKKRGIPRDRLRTIAGSLFALYPQRYKEIFYGMAETSGLGIDEHLLLNAIEWYPKINHLVFDRCSGIAAWGPYTSGGPLVFGRNNDDDPLYKDFARFMVVAVFKPNDLSLPAALINYAGVIYNATGMNNEGLFIELNSGPWMGFALDRASIFVTLFSILQDFSSLAEADPALRSILANLSSIVNAADRSRAYSYESSLYDTRRRDQDRDGLLAATNHFVDPTWNLAQVDDRAASATMARRRNLLTLAEKYRGRFDPRVMMKVLDTTIEQGGATVEGTIYQVIAVPAGLTLWLKVPGLQDWTEVGLAPLFKRQRP